jgi:antirestriction protein ArdC
MAKNKKIDIYQDVTDRIIKALEDGKNGSWKRPWRFIATGDDLATPHNLDGKAYNGINVLLLGIDGHNVSLWGTYNRWGKEGCQVRSGEKGTRIVFWKFLRVKDKDTGKEDTIPLIKTFTVFSVSQVDGFDLDAYVAKRTENAPEPAERLEKAEAAIWNYTSVEGIKVNLGGNRAFYSPQDDTVNSPVREAYKTPEDFCSTLAHECGHSTGHKSRLDRDLKNRFGCRAYAFEELVAELTAAFFCSKVGISDSPREDHIQYIEGWLEGLKKDKHAIFKAASLANKAIRYIIDGPEKAVTLEEAA